MAVIDLTDPLSITRVHVRNGSERTHREELYLERRGDGSLMVVVEEFRRNCAPTRRELGDDEAGATPVEQLLNHMGQRTLSEGWGVEMVSKESVPEGGGPMTYFAINRPKATQHDRKVLAALVTALGTPRAADECYIPILDEKDDIDCIVDGTAVRIQVGSSGDLALRIGHGRRVVFAASVPTGSLSERFLAIVAASELGFESEVQDGTQNLVDVGRILRQPGTVPEWMQKFAELMGTTMRPVSPAVMTFRGMAIAPIVF